MGYIWWDCFCPKCSAAVVGNTADTEEEMEKQQNEYKNTVIYCSCGCVFNFDTGREYSGIYFDDGNIEDLINTCRSGDNNKLKKITDNIIKSREEFEKKWGKLL